MTELRANARISGFTLVELVVVIVILGILGSIAMPRFFDAGVFAERRYYDELASALQYSRKVAVASGCPVRIAVDTAGYEARQQQPVAGRCDPAGAWSIPVVLADGGQLSGSAPGGVAASPTTAIVFDALGRSSLGSDQVITVGGWSLTVRAASGYVETN